MVKGLPPTFLEPQSEHFSLDFAAAAKIQLLQVILPAEVDRFTAENDRRLRAVSTVLFTPPIFPSFKFIVVCVRYPATVIREESRHARMKL